MKDKLMQLINVKSIVTIILTALFVFLAIRGDIQPEVMTIYTTVVAFYFGTQHEKKQNENEVK